MKKIDKPILITGHARAGTTLLAALLNWHSMVGEKTKSMLECVNVNVFINKLLDIKFHRKYSDYLEKRNLWFRYFSWGNIYMKMGKEMINETKKFSEEEINDIVDNLTQRINQNRVLIKNPSLVFALKPLVRLFPNMKILVIHRGLKQVINSWGAEHQINSNFFSRENIITLTKKWMETEEYIKKLRKEVCFLDIYYEDLIKETVKCLEKILLYCDLPIESYIYQVKITNRENWSNRLQNHHLNYIIEGIYKHFKQDEKIN